MKRPTTFLRRVLLDVRLQSLDSIERDLRYIEDRYQSEGFGFLTITLPTLDDALLKGLSRGSLRRSDFQGFRAWKRDGSYPGFLQGFFKRIFGNDGQLLDRPCTQSIFAIRQVCRAFKKVELPCSDSKIRAGYERYRSNDQGISWNFHRSPNDASLWASVCGYLWSDLEDLSGALYCFQGVHGSGATAERLKRNERYTVRQWPQRSEGSFPASFHVGAAEDSEFVRNELEFLAVDDEQPVRVVQVPKTLKAPRTIAVEPSYMMLMQQSIAKPLMRYLESIYRFKGIYFTDQTVNKERARLGSIDGSLATIDLKDASDLVALDLVRSVFGSVAPTFLQLLEDSRSRRAQLPDGATIELKKFASMGSALCFPVEAMVFYTIVIFTMVKASGKRPSRHLIAELGSDVSVYGDDIIVPAKMAPLVMASLEDFGLKVNHDKSFHTGLFRESCGGDFYAGVDVTPVYVRHWNEGGTLRTDHDLVAYVSLSNTLYEKGLWHACQSIRDFVDLFLKNRSKKNRSGKRRPYVPIPLSRTGIGVLHYRSALYSSNLRWDDRTHSFRVRGYRVRSKQVDDAPSSLDGFLLRAFSGKYHSDRIREFGRRDPHRGTSLCSVSHSWNVESSQEGLHSHSCDYRDWAGTTRADGILSHLPDNSDLISTLSEMRRSDAVHWLRSLKKRACGMHTSDEAHTLNLKYGWTASPAGVTTW